MVARYRHPLVATAIAATNIVATSQALAADTFWTTGYALQAGRGTYPNATQYGTTVPLDPRGSAWCSGGGTHVLTWVADVPAGATYHVWVRRYRGYGTFAIRSDDVASSPLANPREVMRTTAEYAWSELGTVALTTGKHHLDVTVQQSGMLDAVLLTSDPNFLPSLDGANLPASVTSPQRRAARSYRTNESALVQAAGSRGYVVARLRAQYPEPYDAPQNDYLPSPADLLTEISFWSARNQYASTTFAVRALTGASAFRASIGALVGPSGARIEQSQIDLKVVGLVPRSLGAFVSGTTAQEPWPDLLLRDDRTASPPTEIQGGFGSSASECALPAHESRQFWLTVNVPNAALPGIYTGKLTLSVEGEPGRSLEMNVKLDIRTTRLARVEGNYSAFLAEYWNSKLQTSGRMEKVFAHLARQGFTNVTLYDASALDTELALASQAGLRGAYATVIAPSTTWADAAARAASARANNGMLDLLFWAADEPQPEGGATPFPVVHARLADARAKGVRSMMSINNETSAQEFSGLVEFPLFAITSWSFMAGASGENAYAASARSSGFVPATYYAAWPSDALYFRAFSGLFNTRLGYQGSVPWFYGAPSSYAAGGLDMNGLAYADTAGEPISSIRLEAMREGIDDVRYLQELDRLVAAARQVEQGGAPPSSLASVRQAAESVRTARFVNGIGGRYFDYLNGLTTALDETRVAFSTAIENLSVPMSYTTQTSVPNEASNGTLRCTDLNGDTLSFKVEDAPAKGSVTITNAATGSFRYTATSGSSGTDAFTYRCGDDATYSPLGSVGLSLVDTRSSLTSRWNFEGNARDTAPFGQANTGTPSSSSVTYDGTDRKVGASALRLPGTGAHVRVSDSPDLNPTSSFTLAMWLQLDDFSGNRRALQKGANGAEYRLYYDLNERGTKRLTFEARIGGTTRLLTANPPALSTWTHVAATYDGTALKLYVNGALAATTPASGQLANTSSSLYIGTRVLGAANSESWRGKLDDVRLLTRVLSQAQLQALMQVSE